MSLVPAEAGFLGAAGISAGVAVGAAVFHVAAAHRLQRIEVLQSA